MCGLSESRRRDEYRLRHVFLSSDVRTGCHASDERLAVTYSRRTCEVRLQHAYVVGLGYLASSKKCVAGTMVRR